MVKMNQRRYAGQSLTESKKKLIDELLNLGILEIAEVKLKYHEANPTDPKSPFKINLRTREHEGPLIPDAVKAIAKEMLQLIRKEKLKFDLIAGIPQAGESFAEIISQLSDKPLLRLKKEVLGEQRRVTGIVEGEIFSPGRVVLLIDDVLTWGASGEEAIRVLIGVGLVVSDLVIGVDRMQGGAEALEEFFGCKTHFLFPLIVVLARAVAIGRITQQKSDEIMAYVRANKRAY